MLFEQGIAGTWGDLGEPEVHPGDARHFLSDAGIEASGDEVHNAFGHEWTRMVYERQVAEYPDMRPMIMMRSGFAGTQRYGIIPWTGDVSRSWGGLKPQVELSLSMGLTGLAYTHSDLGGFTHGVPPDHFRPFEQELYVRWLAYSSLFTGRMHKRACLPNPCSRTAKHAISCASSSTCDTACCPISTRWRSRTRPLACR
jgi:oligosaccharide 4-alpha-D-glucosyltransferase